MAKLIVKIDLNNAMTADEMRSELLKNHQDWFPNGDNMVSIDEAWLVTDENDDSFKSFELVEVTD